jgi:hypothetical protein
LRANMNLALQDARANQNSELFLGRSLVALKAVNALCNVIVDVLAPKIISGSSQMFQAIIEGDKTATVAAIANLTGIKGVPEGLVDYAGKRAVFVRDALYGDVTKSKVLGVVTDNAFLVSKMTFEELAKSAPTDAARGKYGKLVKVFDKAQTIMAFADRALSIIEEYKDNEQLSKGDSAAVKTALDSISMLDRRIGELEALVSGCGIPRLESLT